MLKLYSNEIVFRGHPDKVCDQISDAILDACLEQDKYSRCGIEVVGGKGKIFVTGEVTTNAVVNVEAVVKRVLLDIGYNADYEVINNIGKQSNEIARGVDIGGAGDNGMMFGYACNDTKEALPTAMVILQSLSMAYDELRKIDSRFMPDGKAQITGVYDKDFNIESIKTFTICYQNTELERDITDKIIIDMVENIVSKHNIKVDKYLINPTGKFNIGGFEGDAGLTGRKIVVDSYQSFSNVGGGAFSGKDPTKVDRSGAYKAREIAKDILKSKNLKWCEVQISYAIGVDAPLAIYIDSDIGNINPDPKLYENCTPNNIIKDLRLREIKYEKLARFGHFTN